MIYRLSVTIKSTYKLLKQPATDEIIHFDSAFGQKFIGAELDHSRNTFVLLNLRNKIVTAE